MAPVEPPFLHYLQAARMAAEGPWLGQLATTDPGGAPEVRTVVVRGLWSGAQPYLASDARSDKVRALRASPVAELCLWSSARQEQLRLRGRVIVHPAEDALSRELWRAMHAATRATFAGPPPGTPLYEDRAPQDGAPEDRASAAALAEVAGAALPPPQLVVLRLEPTRVDRLVLGPPLRRHRWWREAAGWRGAPVAP